MTASALAGLWLDDPGNRPTPAYSQYARNTPGDGYVPDADTALRVARSVWRPGYGDVRSIAAQERDGIWHVHGTLPEGKVDGIHYVVICAWNGEILWLAATQESRMSGCRTTRLDGVSYLWFDVLMFWC